MNTGISAAASVFVLLGAVAFCPIPALAQDGGPTPPTVTCTVSTSRLRTPNHNLVNVGLTTTAVDSTGNALAVTVRVFGDEEDEEPTGDGRFSPDAKNIAPTTLRLRAERKGNGNGRVYLIIASATDALGNTGFACCTVVVAHDSSRRSIASVNAQAAAAEAFCRANGTAPPEFFVIGDGPVIGPKQ
jgi:hypothetical protein